MQMPLLERRKHFKPTRSSNGTLYRFYSRLTKVTLKGDSLIFDKYLNVSYLLNTDIGRTLYYTGEFESSEITYVMNTALKNVDKPVILDIGANIGLHSIEFAKFNGQSTVYAFEPSPDTRRILQDNIASNQLSTNVRVLPDALSDHNGTAKFYQTDDNAYNSLKDTKRKKVVSTVDVNLVTMDTFIEQNDISRLDLVKIDVEGLDHEVVLGGLKSLQKLRPVLFIEIYKGTNSNPDPERTVRALIDIGYRAFVLVNGVAVPFEKHSDQLYNYLFIK